ncbi:MAG TPA: hypothetical protein VF375_07860 [Candidatus Limnocylindrales bacterium]|jgi:hypothetical protein
MLLMIDNERTRATLERRFEVLFGGCFTPASGLARTAGTVPPETYRCF